MALKWCMTNPVLTFLLVVLVLITIDNIVSKLRRD